MVKCIRTKVYKLVEPVEVRFEIETDVGKILQCVGTFDTLLPMNGPAGNEGDDRIITPMETSIALISNILTYKVKEEK